MLDPGLYVGVAAVSVVAAGSLFVYIGKHRAVMINYPPYAVLKDLLRHG